jgi:hypothetical protein
MTCLELLPVSDRLYVTQQLIDGCADLGRDITSMGNRCPFPVILDQILSTSVDVPSLYIGHSDDGRRCLVAHLAVGTDVCRWLYAEASDLAIGRLLAGRASPDDLFRHSLTGSIEIVDMDVRGRPSESTRLCHDLGDDVVMMY